MNEIFKINKSSAYRFIQNESKLIYLQVLKQQAPVK